MLCQATLNATKFKRINFIICFSCNFGRIFKDFGRPWKKANYKHYVFTHCKHSLFCFYFFKVSKKQQENRWCVFTFVCAMFRLDFCAMFIAFSSFIYFVWRSWEVTRENVDLRKYGLNNIPTSSVTLSVSCAFKGCKSVSNSVNQFPFFESETILSCPILT